MQWNNQKNAGFSDAEKTWLPINEDVEKINVRTQLANKDSLLNAFKQLIRLRNKHAALHSGSIEIVQAGNKDILAFIRSVEDEKIMVLINFSNADIRITLNQELKEILFSVKSVDFTGSSGILSGFNGVMLKI